MKLSQVQQLAEKCFDVVPLGESPLNCRLEWDLVALTNLKIEIEAPLMQVVTQQQNRLDAYATGVPSAIARSMLKTANDLLTEKAALVALIRSIAENVRAANYVQARSDALRALEKYAEPPVIPFA